MYVLWMIQSTYVTTTKKKQFFSSQITLGEKIGDSGHETPETPEKKRS